jgi:Skp family chaperone for outer membrane proteins
MKSVGKLCVILFLATGLVGQTSTAPKPRKAKPADATVTAADVQALRDAIASQQAALAQQQQQIQALRDELHNKDQAAQQAQSAAADAASKADAAQAQTAQQQQAVSELKGDVSDLKTNMASTVVTVQEAQKTISGPPTAIHVKGITITPGGFLAAETVYRQRALGADINTPFNSVPYNGSSNYNMSEFFGSGRQSRISMLAEGRLRGAKLSGYVEADFLSAGVTSNNNQSNSYTMRQRQAWGQAAMDNGWSITGGQMWSLLTETKKGVDNRSEALPMTIDPQYTVGFTWARQYGLRVAKNFGNKVWLAVAVENSQATLTSHNNASNFLVGTAGVTGGLYDNQSNYSFNPSPDIVAKLAFEPGFGHYEIFGVYSRFRDRVFPCENVAATTVCGGSANPGPNATDAFNSSKNGGGFGANARWSFAHKHVDFGLHGFGGSGEGRYGTAGLPDVSVHTDGTLNLVKSLQGLSTLEFHTSRADVYFNGGAEYAGRAADYDPIQKKYVGYGSPFFVNTGCLTETGPGSGGFAPGALSNCSGDTRVVVEATGGVWFKVFDGAKEKLNWGRIQFGPQYSVVIRNAWSGAGFPSEAQGIDNMVFTSFRYYLP